MKRLILAMILFGAVTKLSSMSELTAKEIQNRSLNPALDEGLLLFARDTYNNAMEGIKKQRAQLKSGKQNDMKQAILKSLDALEASVHDTYRKTLAAAYNMKAEEIKFKKS